MPEDPSPTPLSPISTAPQLPPARAGLYLHVPFCSQICPYCDFAVRRDRPSDHDAYVDALLQEICQAGELWPARAGDEPAAQGFDTIYWGGGTPSLLEGDTLERLLEALHRHLPIDDDATLFFEANPEDIDHRRLELWRRLGVSFLSLGVQALDDADLQALGRRHRGEEAVRGIQQAVEAGFATVSVDLMYGFPGHTADAWRQTLDRVADLEPHHLSCYELEIHQRTVFGKRHARGELVPLAEPRRAELFELTHRHLVDLGYTGYEVSNFARSPELQSRHNRKYWHHVPYLGLGPSAHSYAGRRRWWNHRHLPRWRRAVLEEGSAMADDEVLQPTDLVLEALMLGLRTRDGVDLEALEAHFGVPVQQGNEPLLEQLQTHGLLHRDGHRIRPTLAGMAVADGLAARFDLPSTPA